MELRREVTSLIKEAVDFANEVLGQYHFQRRQYHIHIERLKVRNIGLYNTYRYSMFLN